VRDVTAAREPPAIFDALVTVNCAVGDDEAVAREAAAARGRQQGPVVTD
jgi:hypothetical protein